MAVNHQSDIIKSFFGDGSKWNIDIDYSLEYQSLGTMAPLKLINDLPENFLVLNGDVLTDLDFSNFFHQHLNQKNLFSISTSLREHIVDYGVLKTDSNNQLVKFIEKPNYQYQVSMGVYALNRKVLDYIPSKKTFGFDDLMYKLLYKNKVVKILEHDGYWLDIGRPDDYMQAIDAFEENKKSFLHE